MHQSTRGFKLPEARLPFPETAEVAVQSTSPPGSDRDRSGSILLVLRPSKGSIYQDHARGPICRASPLLPRLHQLPPQALQNLITVWKAADVVGRNSEVGVDVVQSFRHVFGAGGHEGAH